MPRIKYTTDFSLILRKHKDGKSLPSMGNTRDISGKGSYESLVKLPIRNGKQKSAPKIGALFSLFKYGLVEDISQTKLHSPYVSYTSGSSVGFSN
jgi:hypothetical protein